MSSKPSALRRAQAGTTAEPAISPLMGLRLNPFRVFFPAGILVAFIGTGLWILWSVGVPVPAVAFQHAMLQTQGFLAFVVVGFLMTAFPRFSGTAPAAMWEIGGVSALLAAFVALVLAQAWVAAYVAWGAAMLLLLVFAGRRVPGRTKPLPPPFLLLGFGFLHAIAGTALVAGTDLGGRSAPLFLAGRQMIQVGFVLCLVLGVAGKLTPFLFGYTDDRPDDEDPSTAARASAIDVAVHGAAGAAIFVSFLIEPHFARAAWVLRAAVVTAHLLAYARIARPRRRRTPVTFFFKVSLWMVAAAFWVGAITPLHRILALHILFIGGFSLMIFSFGLMVVLSHSQRAKLLNTRLIPLHVVGWISLVSLAVRAAADLFTPHYQQLLLVAGVLWVAAAAVWLAYVAPKLAAPAPAAH